MGQVVSFLPVLRQVGIAKKKPSSDRSRKRAELTPAQKLDAKRLEHAWAEAERAGQKISKKELASLWGVNPSNVSLYINGHIALNVEAQLRFARYLRCIPTDIWPDFEFSDMVPGRLPADAIEIAIAYSRVQEEAKPYAKGIIERLPKKT